MAYTDFLIFFFFSRDIQLVQVWVLAGPVNDICRVETTPLFVWLCALCALLEDEPLPQYEFQSTLGQDVLIYYCIYLALDPD